MAILISLSLSSSLNSVFPLFSSLESRRLSDAREEWRRRRDASTEEVFNGGWGLDGKRKRWRKRRSMELLNLLHHSVVSAHSQSNTVTAAPLVHSRASPPCLSSSICRALSLLSLWVFQYIKTTFLFVLTRAVPVHSVLSVFHISVLNDAITLIHRKRD